MFASSFVPAAKRRRRRRLISLMWFTLAVALLLALFDWITLR